MTQDAYKFFHAADLHIDSPLRGLSRYEEAPAEEIRLASRAAFENLIRRAIEIDVDFLILAGDIFDGAWRDFNTGLWFTARLRDLTTEGMRVYILAGNHDAEGKMTASLRYPDGVRTFGTSEPETLIDSETGAALHGQGFAKAATTEDLAAGYPAAHPGTINIGVLHTALSGREGHSPYAPCTLDGLRAHGYDYWALGHVHQREVCSEDPWIIFSGNLQARNIREHGAKGATLVTVDGGGIVSVEEEAFDVVRFARVLVDVSACTTLAACEDAVALALTEAKSEADGRLLAVRIEVSGRSPADATLRRNERSFVAACRDQSNALDDLWVEKVKISTSPVSSTTGADIVEALDLEAEDLASDVLAAASADIDALLNKLPPGMDLAADGLDLRDEKTLERLLDEARDEVVRRLIDEDAAMQHGDSA